MDALSLADSEKAAPKSWDLTLLFQPSNPTAFLQTLFQPHTSPPFFYPCLSEKDDKYLCTTKHWSLWLIILRLVGAVQCYCRVFAVFFWGFLRVMRGFIWTDYRIGMGWFLEIIAERKKHALLSPFSRKTKTKQQPEQIWHLTFPRHLEMVNILSGSWNGCLGAAWFQEGSEIWTLDQFQMYSVWDRQWNDIKMVLNKNSLNKENDYSVSMFNKPAAVKN